MKIREKLEDIIDRVQSGASAGDTGTWREDSIYYCHDAVDQIIQLIKTDVIGKNETFKNCITNQTGKWNRNQLRRQQRERLG